MAGSTWPDLIAGRKAKASEVESKFDWLEGTLLPMNSGSTTDLSYDLGSETKRWNAAYLGGINPTTTAGGVAIGTSTADAGTLLDISGVKALRIPRLSSTQRDAITGRDGMLIFNSSTSQLQVFRNAAWGNVGSTVFRTQPLANTQTAAAATLTALNITTGGGRLNGVILKTFNLGTTAELRVYLDGVLVRDFTTPTSPSTYYFGAAGDAFQVNQATGSSANDLSNTGATGSASPFLGWDFATSCTVYLFPSVAATVSAHFTYSLIV